MNKPTESDLNLASDLGEEGPACVAAIVKHRTDAIDDVLSRFETLAAGYHCVGNDDAALGIRSLISEIRKDGV